jgi:small subunit ribosomal protein S8
MTVMNDPLGDMLARIRNAQMRGKTKVRTPASKLRGWVLDVLLQEGYIRGYSKDESVPAQAEFEIELKYFDGTPVIRELRRVSTPGRRVYRGVKDLAPVRNGLGVAILSTPRGIMTDAQARGANVGGEVLCTVF